MVISSASWRELPRPTKSECPKLFYRFSTEDDNLNVKVTDLVAIWECSLNRNAIIEAAREQSSSIDPSESNAQLGVLLEKLEQSLGAGNNKILRADGSAVQRVHLKTRLELPKPLKALSWTFDLEPQDAGELAEQLLRPCLHEAYVTKQKVESLLRVIKDKDHVLSRLLEKVDSSAIDLSLIFPGVTGLKSRKGRVTAQEAQKHVPGMAEFDYEKWSQGFDNGSPYAGFDQMGMSSLIAGCERCPKHTVKQHCNWLKGLPADDGQSTATTPGSKQTAKRKPAEASSSSKDKSTDTESDFERQPTPPHLKPSKAKAKRTAQSHSSAGSNDSDEEQSRPTKKAKLGRVGGSNTRKRSSPTSKLSSSPPPLHESSEQPSGSKNIAKANTVKQQGHSPDSDTETASEDDSLNPKDSRTPHTRRQTQQDNHKLGKLSGKHNTNSSQSISPETKTRHSSSLSKANQRQARGKLNQSQSSKPTPASASASNIDPDTETDTEDERTLNPPDKVQRTSNPKAKSKSPSPAQRTPTKELPLTPSRRLGRLGRRQSTSNSASQSESPSHRPKHGTIGGGRKDIPKAAASSAADEVMKDDSDTATATASDSDTGKATTKSKQKATDKRIKSSMSPQPPSRHSDSTPLPEPESEPQKEETAVEKANRRREELKKKLNPGGSGGVRKTRKF